MRGESGLAGWRDGGMAGAAAASPPRLLETKTCDVDVFRSFSSHQFNLFAAATVTSAPAVLLTKHGVSLPGGAVTVTFFCRCVCPPLGLV